MEDSKGFLALERLEKLLTQILPILSRFPKTHRYTLGEKIENTLLTLAELLHDYQYAIGVRVEKINRARSKVHLVLFLLRVSFESKFISSGSYEDLSFKVSEIGKMLTGAYKKHTQGGGPHAKRQGPAGCI